MPRYRRDETPDGGNCTNPGPIGSPDICLMGHAGAWQPLSEKPPSDGKTGPLFRKGTAKSCGVRAIRPAAWRISHGVFLTLEDEWGLIPVVWEGRWDQLKHALLRPLVVIDGTVSRRDNTLNVMAERAWPLSVPFYRPPTPAGRIGGR